MSTSSTTVSNSVSVEWTCCNYSGATPCLRKHAVTCVFCCLHAQASLFVSCDIICVLTLLCSFGVDMHRYMCTVKSLYKLEVMLFFPPVICICTPFCLHKLTSHLLCFVHCLYLVVVLNLYEQLPNTELCLCVFPA